MEIRKIYFDMDGVLADFERGVSELCGLDPVDQDLSDRQVENTMWEKIREAGHFYDRLELMPGAKKLFDTVYDKYADRCEILTGIPKPGRGILTAADDKKNWIRRLLSEEITVNIVFKEQKPEYCTGRDCILIDDRKKNIEEWVSVGGTGILHTGAEETLSALTEMGAL